MEPLPIPRWFTDRVGALIAPVLARMRDDARLNRVDAIAPAQTEWIDREAAEWLVADPYAAEREFATEGLPQHTAAGFARSERHAVNLNDLVVAGLLHIPAGGLPLMFVVPELATTLPVLPQMIDHLIANQPSVVLFNTADGVRVETGEPPRRFDTLFGAVDHVAQRLFRPEAVALAATPDRVNGLVSDAFAAFNPWPVLAVPDGRRLDDIRRAFWRHFFAAGAPGGGLGDARLRQMLFLGDDGGYVFQGGISRDFARSLVVRSLGYRAGERAECAACRLRIGHVPHQCELNPEWGLPPITRPPVARAAFHVMHPERDDWAEFSHCKDAEPDAAVPHPLGSVRIDPERHHRAVTLRFTRMSGAVVEVSAETDTGDVPLATVRVEAERVTATLNAGLFAVRYRPRDRNGPDRLEVQLVYPAVRVRRTDVGTEPLTVGLIHNHCGHYWLGEPLTCPLCEGPASRGLTRLAIPRLQGADATSSTGSVAAFPSPPEYEVSREGDDFTVRFRDFPDEEWRERTFTSAEELRLWRMENEYYT